MNPSMNSGDIVEALNAQRPAVVSTLKGQVLSYDPAQRSLRMAFHIGLEFCHSVDTVQGGLVTAMLDAAMAHVMMAAEQGQATVASIDINVSFLRRARAGRFEALGYVVKPGRSVAFLRAELFDAAGELVAAATSSGHLTRHAAARG